MKLSAAIAVAVLSTNIGASGEYEWNMTLDWQPQTHWKDGTPYSPEELAQIQYVVYVSGKETNWRLYAPSPKLDHPHTSYTIWLREPGCWNHYIKVYNKVHNEFSPPSDITRSCIDENGETTDEFLGPAQG